MTDDLLKKVEDKYGKAYTNALKFTMNSEGLFANHINDKGGKTYKGIAYVYNSRWDGWKIIDKYLEQFPELQTPWRKPPTSLDRLNKLLNANDELNMMIIDFYFENYFKRSGAYAVSKICDKAGIILFDISVLQGVKRAGKTIQRLLNRYYGHNLLVDGLVGNKTIEAFKVSSELNKDSMINNIILEYVDNLNEASKLGNNHIFLKGWINRTTNLRNYLRLLK